MGAFVIILILISAFMHAGWNLLARGQKSERVFFGEILLVIAAAGFLPAVISEIVVRSITPVAWWCLAGSGFCCAVYYFFLGKAYEDSDFTIVYPLVRAIPILLIASGDILRGRVVSTAGWIGIVLVVAGCFLSPLHSFTQFKLSRYLKLSRVWILIAALGTTGYTLLDKIASEVVIQGAGTAGRYCYLFFFFSGLFYFLFLWMSKLKVQNLAAMNWKSVIGAAICNYAAYMLVIWAYQLSENACYIAAFRQVSIIIGVAIAFVIYKEKGVAVRLAGTNLMTFGLVIIGLWA